MRKPSEVIGTAPERLTLAERIQWSGKWVAVELYSPRTLPLRVIAAFGDSVRECARQLQQSGHDVTRFEYQVLTPPY